MAARPIPLEDFRAEVLELYRPPTRAPLTFGKMRQVFDLLAAQGVGTVADLTPAAVARFAAACAAERRPSTVKGLLSYLSAACSYAEFRRYLDASPFRWRRDWLRGGLASTRPAREVRHHGRAEVARVLAHLRGLSGDFDGGRLYALACTFAFAALRLREALYLRVEDFDPVARTLAITARWRPLKTDASAAVVPVASPLLGVLACWAGRCGSEWLFPTVHRRRPWTGGMPGRKPTPRLVAAGRAVGVEGFTPLSLRHSFATHAPAWGISREMVRRILRHTSARTQLHYTHADVPDLVEAVDRVAYDAA